MVSFICPRPSNLSKTALDFPRMSKKLPKKFRSSVDAYLFCKQCGSGFRRVDWFGKTTARIGGFTPLKKREREASVSHSQVYCMDVPFVIKSVVANGFSYFLFLLFCARKIMSFKTFADWEKLACLADHRRGEESKWALEDPATFEPSRASCPQPSRTSRARLSLFPPLRLRKSEKRPVPKRKQL